MSQSVADGNNWPFCLLKMALFPLGYSFSQKVILNLLEYQVIPKK
jgi:hypothetical protein